MPKPLKMSLIAAILMAVLGVPAVHGQSAAAKAAADEAKKQSKLEALTKDMTKVEGLFTLYHNDQKLYAIIKSSDLDKNFLVLTSIARGVSSGMVLGGMSWGSGDDVIWTFKKVGDRIHVARRNVRFKASDYPETNAVKLAYSDSVLYALDIKDETGGGYLVDLSKIFMSDDQQVGAALGGFSFASDRSTWAKVKAFEKNVELQVAAVYSGRRNLDTVSDPRGVQVNVHYSISRLPENSYKPRLADDRIGYFLTVHKDFSKNDGDEHFVRFVNRWNLKKKDPNAKLSPPEKPIKFYMEKTIPVWLRPTVRAGILEWNKAFEKLGIANAIEVEQQTDDATWDPEDVSYNTFRWITAEAGFAMGPSRVNPLTGEILDADIIFDASFLRSWNTKYETFTEDDARALMGGRPPVADDKSKPVGSLLGHGHGHLPGHECTLCKGMQQQMGFAAATFAARGMTTEDGKLPEEFVHQGLKHVVMHEVGHTLGLRHNFKASAWKSLNDASGDDEATVASVMDYSPANIAAKGGKQGLYYSQTIGPYDYWAIEYGYKPIGGNEKDELAKIASRCCEPGLDYATDEDARGMNPPDPLANLFDLGGNPIEFATRQMKISTELTPKILERAVEKGDGYQRARQAFGVLFSEYWRTAYFASRFPGGVHVYRDHKGDPNERPPFEVVSAKQQREAMKLLAETAFATPSYDHKLLNHLAATRWSHWGLRNSGRIDYPIHDVVELMQSQILRQLLDSTTLSRLHDNELKVAQDADAYTLAEHVRTLVDSIFTEWQKVEKAGEYTNRKPYLSSFRRNLQRTALKRLISLVMQPVAPEDARTLARMHLSKLDGEITAVLEKKDLKLDEYSRAHLADSQKRIRQALDAELQMFSVN